MHRTDRERRAYDRDGVWEARNRIQRRFLHLFRGPNSLRLHGLVDAILQESGAGARVLERPGLLEFREHDASEPPCKALSM